MTRNSIFLTLALCAVSVANTNAQTKKIPAPETLNEVQFYNRTTHTLVPLEKGKAGFETRTKGLGLGGATVNFEMAGEKSTIRIKSSDTLSFAVTLADAMGDPNGFLTLYKANVKKGKRVAAYSTMKVYWGKNASGDVIEWSVRKIGANGFEIIPATKLEPGEYLIVNRGTLATYGGRAATCFAFGVD